MVFTIQYISIFIELIIAIVGILIAVKKKRVYGWGIFLTFFIYVFYDLIKLLGFEIPTSYLYLLYFSFFVATISALWAVWCIYKERKTKSIKPIVKKKKRGKRK